MPVALPKSPNSSLDGKQKTARIYSRNTYRVLWPLRMCSLNMILKANVITHFHPKIIRHVVNVLRAGITV